MRVKIFLGILIIAAALSACVASQQQPLVGESELVPLLSEINRAREESANVLAELIETKNNPATAPGDEEISQSLVARLEQNHLLVDSILSEIGSQVFANQEVSLQYWQMEGFYRQLVAFENYVIDNLSQIDDASAFSEFINRLFETESAWPELIAADEAFRNLLNDFASRHTFEFEDKPYYEEIFRARLGELRAPAAPVILDQLGQITYEFDFPEQFRQTVVSASWSGVQVEVFQFALQHPDGRTLHFKLAPLDDQQYIYNIPINKLPVDGSVVIIPSEEYPAVENVAGGTNDSNAGYEQTVLAITLLSKDPMLAPMAGKWSLTVTAPAGLEIIFGAAPIP
jgi:hypothetical protein